MWDVGGGHWLVRMEWHPAGWSVCLRHVFYVLPHCCVDCQQLTDDDKFYKFLSASTACARVQVYAMSCPGSHQWRFWHLKFIRARRHTLVNDILELIRHRLRWYCPGSVASWQPVSTFRCIFCCIVEMTFMLIWEKWIAVLHGCVLWFIGICCVSDIVISSLLLRIFYCLRSLDAVGSVRGRTCRQTPI